MVFEDFELENAPSIREQFQTAQNRLYSLLDIAAAKAQGVSPEIAQHAYSDVSEQVVTALNAGFALTPSEIAAYLQIEESEVYTALYAATEAGRVECLSSDRYTSRERER